MNARMKTEMLYIKSMPPHYHEEELELLLVLSGSLTIHRMERHTELHEGQFTFINRRIVHYITSDGAFVLSTHILLREFRQIFERMEYVEFMNQDSQKGLKKPLKPRLDAIVIDFMIQDYKLCRCPEQTAEKEFNENQLVDFIFLGYQMASCLKKDDEHLNQELTERFYCIVEYIMTHVHEKIMVEDIMKLVYMNPAYFSQFMKKAGGVGFKDFFLYRKLMVINMLLLDPQYSISEIASLVNLNDMKAFYQMFKKYYHTSPAKWREMLWQIPEDFRYCEEPDVLRAFMQKFRFDKHRENSLARLYRYITKCKKEGVSLEDTEISVAPYADWNEQEDPDYQPYKYSGALIHLIQNVKARLVLVYPLRVLLDEQQYRLLMQTLQSFTVLHGINEMRKWKIVIQIEQNEDIRKAQQIRQDLIRQFGISNVFVRILS